MSIRIAAAYPVLGITLASLLAIATHVAAQPQTPTPPDPPPVPAGEARPPVTAPPVPAPPVTQPEPPAVSPPGAQSIDLPNGSGQQLGFNGQGRPDVQRFPIKIAPDTPVKDLLPTPPEVQRTAGPVLTDDLAKVPEVDFRASPQKNTPQQKLTEQAAHQLARINFANAKKTDAFMTALLESRPDLAGLPFVMGDDCRTNGEHARQFTIAVNTVRQALGGGQMNLSNTINFNSPPLTGSNPFGQQSQQPNASPLLPQTGNFIPQTGNTDFWTQFRSLCEQQDSAKERADQKLAEYVTLARIAALTQMLAAESAEMRLGLVKYLNAVPTAEATRVLARMAIYSAEANVRSAALDSLKVRRERDYTDVLIAGLRYPWPAVAQRAAEAVVKLERADLTPELIGVLEVPDARMPQTKQVEGKSVVFVRELVKVNHHRNCIMCHAPGSTENVSGNIITAEVAVPGQPLPLPSQGYRQSSPDLMIRIDVTYLRQDFSAMLPVSDAHPWPDTQRFDFFVRERTLTAEEAVTYRDRLTPKEAGVLPPHHRSALAALRSVTGKDTAPTAEAWRKLLNLPAKATPASTEGSCQEPAPQPGSN